MRYRGDGATLGEAATPAVAPSPRSMGPGLGLARGALDRRDRGPEGGPRGASSPAERPIMPPERPRPSVRAGAHRTGSPPSATYYATGGVVGYCREGDDLCDCLTWEEHLMECKR
jgi:hypothetical protein